jgi:hypothetical protein
MNRKLGIPLVILAVLVVVALLLEGPCARKTGRQLESPLGIVKGDQVTALEIRTPRDSVRLEREGEEWLVLTDTSSHRADTRKANELVETAVSIRGPVISKNPKKRDLFEVTENAGTEVRLLGAEYRELGRFIVGKTTPDFTTSYVRGYDSDEVIQAPGYLRVNFEANPDRWRNRRLLFFEKDSLTRGELQEEDGTLTVEVSREGVWSVVDPAGAIPDTTAMRNLQNSLSRLFAAGFADELGPEEAGLDAPSAVARVTLRDGSVHEVRVGNLKEDDDTKYYVTVSGDPTIYTVAKWTVERIKRPVAEFLVE